MLTRPIRGGGGFEGIRGEAMSIREPRFYR